MLFREDHGQMGPGPPVRQVMIVARITDESNGERHRASRL